MTVESKMRTSPSSSAGSSTRGLTSALGADPINSLVSKGTPFSRKAIRTFWA
jgi:hypothetical protein